MSGLRPTVGGSSPIVLKEASNVISTIGHIYMTSMAMHAPLLVSRIAQEKISNALNRIGPAIVS